MLHVLLAAMRFQMEDVAKACCDFLMKNLEPSNVIGIARFAEEIGCVELHQLCREYINSHFSEVDSSTTTNCPVVSIVSQITSGIFLPGDQRRGVLQSDALPTTGAYQPG